MDIHQLIDAVQEAAYEVRKHLSPGFVENVYKKALYYELRLRGIDADMERALTIEYKGFDVGDYRADIVIGQQLIIETKAVSMLLPTHSAQIVNYLHATGIDYGLLINYGGDKFEILTKTRIYKPF